MRPFLFTICALLLSANLSWGSAIFHVGDPPDSGGYLYDNELRPVSLDGVQFVNNSSKTIDFNDPIWLIVGVPNAAGMFAAPEIASISSGKGALSADRSKRNFDSGEIYGFLGLSGNGLPSSNAFVNWRNAFAGVTGSSVSEFDVFVYFLTGTDPNRGPVDIGFAGSFPEGSIAAVYGTSTGHNGADSNYGTPFTESGMMYREQFFARSFLSAPLFALAAPEPVAQSVPEPATFFLAASGLALLAFLRGRMRPL